MKQLQCELCKRPMTCFVGGLAHCGESHIWIAPRWRRREPRRVEKLEEKQ